MFSQKLPIHDCNVLIIWNRSYRNLWDELILIGTLKLLLKQNNHIVIQAYDPKRLRSFLKQFIDISKITVVTEIPKGVRSIFKYLVKGKIRERMKMWKCNAVIVGGWEILTEENPNSYRYRLISLLPSLIRKLTKPTQIYLMGGIQIPKKNQNKKLFDYLLQQTTAIFARDEESVEDLMKYWYQNVSFFMDTAYFAYDWGTSKQSHKHIIININKNGSHFVDQLLRDMKVYVDQWFAIDYLPVSKGNQSDYNDIEYLEQIKTAYPKAKITILDWESDFHHFVERISSASLVISSRLHLFLIASFIWVPTKVYPYQKKIVKMQNIVQKYCN